MYQIGIDIGSTAAKVAVMKNTEIWKTFVLPTGWSSIDTANNIKKRLSDMGVEESNSKIVATGYGRVSVPFADKTITEITCHAVGAKHFIGENTTVVDIGGQDTKVISLEGGVVKDFTMNDKCSAGTGKFIEVMSNSLGVDIDTLTDLAREGSGIEITSMCTVFAESEVISLIGRGEKRENIAFGIVDSVIKKVNSLCSRHGESDAYFLTGGLSRNPYILEELSKAMGKKVVTHELGRYAGAIGAAILAKKIEKN
ncbi:MULTISPECIES: acyl-CoA dehydratase activase [Psychrilyobacter]|uniref:CoA activase n=1 Tax=Psychrilyobacter piezotolerans TaxID=2293438 RepID=A0ABX9KF80_9FUSO|nr:MULTISPECIES: acyl-CoA dehydratase activase [Psychrilyobacter]MCS5422507.1 acyl-CoA dehydratase activase [Psychrilyobacter sp. S5]NDI78619.1 CoA activase [Psychrilyobacter piezotolerans]RDE60321.1 CoA activase [Psychrilyobacter sp. S5]REI40429.1 CoA activase [Psychrilyobacter piezotolerans]